MTLVDAGHQLAPYDIWKEKSLQGIKYLGVERTTVVIDRTGRIARIFPKVKLPGNVEEEKDGAGVGVTRR